MTIHILGWLIHNVPSYLSVDFQFLSRLSTIVVWDAKLISLYLFPMKNCGKMVGFFCKTLWISTFWRVGSKGCG